MSGPTGMSGPIPEPRDDDHEDVHWALSTAVAVWARGEQQEALKWLRRAAESASDLELDDRALELFKAAADLSTRVQAGAPAPSPSQPAAAPPPASPSPPARGQPPPPPRGRPASRPPGPGPAPHAQTPHGPTSQVEPMASTQPQPRVSPYAATQVPSARGAQQPPPTGFANPARGMTPPMRGGPAVSPTPPAASPSGSVSSPRTLPARGMTGPSQPVAAKTLASGSYTDMRAQEAIRRGVAKTHTPQTSGALPIAPTQQPMAVAPAVTQGAAGAPKEPDPPASSSRTGRRRATQSGRKSGVTNAIANLPITPSVDVAIMESNSETSRKPTVRRDVREESTSFDVPPRTHDGRFEDEQTIDNRPPPRSSPPTSSFDLEEKTNVLSRADLERRIDPRDDAAGVDVAVDDDPPEPTRIERFRSPREEMTGEMSTTHDSVSMVGPTLGLISFRVALANDPARGTVDLHTLAPGEPTPAGMVSAILVPTDLASSQAISELLQSGTKKRGR